ncbi:MAG: glycosidase [Clostridiaceae bacterium]|nr:glycosidase [Clostridiaceae bacterium]
MDRDATRLFTRCEKNPILDVKDFPGVAQLYNPSPAIYKDETILLVSVVEHTAEGEGRDVGQTWVARSKDGVNFNLERKKFIQVPDVYPFNLAYHFIDNRITKIDDTYFIITPVKIKGFASPLGLLGKTKDFESYEPIDFITLPRNRGASLFPEKINGKYYRLDRPNGDDAHEGDIWLSSSPDLIHWGGHRPVLAAGYRYWNTRKIGPTPPIKTEKGWLEIIHGVFRTAGGIYYYIGAILLDLLEPWKVIGKTNSYLLAPEAEYERHGNCDNCVFPCGAVADYEKDEIRLYYGAADNYICLATASLSEVVRACIDGI